MIEILANNLLENFDVDWRYKSLYFNTIALYEWVNWIISKNRVKEYGLVDKFNNWIYKTVYDVWIHVLVISKACKVA